MESERTHEVFNKAALQMRDDVKKQDYRQSWRPQMSAEMANDAILTSMTRFLHVLLTGTTDCASPSNRVQRLCSSFAQDLIYAFTSGEVKPLKQITLPFTVKSLTENVELVHVLNRLGHCVSYSRLQEIDTALCLFQMVNLHCQEIYIPGSSPN